MGKLSVIFAPTAEVPIEGSEHTVTVRGLSIGDIDILFDKHEDAILRAWEKYNAGSTDLDFESVVTVLRTDAPEMIPTVIALANDDPDGRDNASRLPVATQVDCILSILKLTITSIDTLKKILWTVVNGLEEMNAQMSGSAETLGLVTQAPVTSNGTSGKKPRLASRKATGRPAATP